MFFLEQLSKEYQFSQQDNYLLHSSAFHLKSLVEENGKLAVKRHNNGYATQPVEATTTSTSE
jgi:hypothetical protein